MKSSLVFVTGLILSACIIEGRPMSGGREDIEKEFELSLITLTNIIDNETLKGQKSISHFVSAAKYYMEVGYEIDLLTKEIALAMNAIQNLEDENCRNSISKLKALLDDGPVKVKEGSEAIVISMRFLYTKILKDLVAYSEIPYIYRNDFRNCEDAKCMKRILLNLNVGNKYVGEEIQGTIRSHQSQIEKTIENFDKQAVVPIYSKIRSILEESENC